MRDAAAVVGLGDLGIAIARRLHAVGVEVAGIDGAEDRRELWERETGLPALTSTAELDPAGVPRALVCVRTTDQAGAVIADLNGRLGASAVIYVVTTLAVDFARGLGRRAAADGPSLIELPVSGGRGGAERGELVVLPGGSAVEPDDVGFLERTLASHVLPMPRYGEATLAKLLNNALAAYNALAYASAVELAARAGLDVGTTAELMRRGSGGSWMAEAFEGLVDDLLAKDAALLAAELGPLPTIDLGDLDALPLTLARARRMLAGRKLKQ
ncbi:MAG TPA: NAD(P)-binding domain-containing protein [Solirubrobacterales bacterium]|nr:NAD(P)-binding domain-containing protein [Solirubrobacterales bacterium]